MAKKKGADEPAIAPYKPRSRVTVSLHTKHGKFMPRIKIGRKGRLAVSGKLTGFRSDEYGHSFDMDLDHLEEMRDEAPRSLTQAIKRRKMRDGRFA
jgi:hypothetical protein